MKSNLTSAGNNLQNIQSNFNRLKTMVSNWHIIRIIQCPVNRFSQLAQNGVFVFQVTLQRDIYSHTHWIKTNGLIALILFTNIYFAIYSLCKHVFYLFNNSKCYYIQGGHNIDWKVVKTLHNYLLTFLWNPFKYVFAHLRIS